MWPGFWRASLFSLAAYSAAVLIGIWIGLWFTLAAIPVLQVVWSLFCGIRILQLRREGGHKPGAPETERESYGFALGGLISSFALLVMLVAASQAVTGPLPKSGT
jgi:tetrahydromethanopterin S-methyltransferase subunit B